MSEDRKVVGVREQKKRETYERIAEVGLSMFMDRGFESTTIDEIARASGISRRTFFYYFKSKEDVLLAHSGSGFSKSLYAAVLEESADQKPMTAIENCLTKLATRYESPKSIAFDSLLRSTDSLRAKKELLFIELERDLCQAMGEVWTGRSQQSPNHLVAATAIGVLRFSLEEWRNGGGKEKLAFYLRNNFKLLKMQF